MISDNNLNPDLSVIVNVAVRVSVMDNLNNLMTRPVGSIMMEANMLTLSRDGLGVY